MMRLTCAFALSLFLSSAALAQTAEQRYQGTFYILSTTSQCSGEIARLNRDFLFVFRTDPDKQLIGLFGTPLGVSIRTSTTGRFAASGSYAATKIGSGANVSTYTGAYSSFVISPATFAASTLSVLVRGTLTNFDGIAGCTITFRGGGARRPEPF